MSVRSAAPLLLLLLLLVLPAASAGAPHAAYLPKAGDRFSFREVVLTTNGVGNYSGYTDQGFYNATYTMTAVTANGTVAATYAENGEFSNNEGQSGPWSEGGAFSFSPATRHYVNGTDNQTGYVDPYVWFYIDPTVAVGSTVYLLNTGMNVVSHDAPYADPTSSTGYVATVFLEGNGSYQRNDAYGKFTADYQWKAYFDPTTGYLVGYVDTETDSDGMGDGFAMSDTVQVTQSTYALTDTAAPPPPPAAASSFPYLEVVAVVVVLVVIVLIVVVASRRSRGARPGLSGGNIPRHSGPIVPPDYGPPPPINLTPGGQPAIQQIVIKETVKVPCRYCGTLIDSTATACPKCGAPRT